MVTEQEVFNRLQGLHNNGYRSVVELEKDIRECFNGCSVGGVTDVLVEIDGNEEVGSEFVACISHDDSTTFYIKYDSFYFFQQHVFMLGIVNVETDNQLIG